VTGAVDWDSAERTRDIMQSRIFWARVRLWEFIDTVKYKKVAADRAIVEQNMLEAHALHHEIAQFSDVLWPLRQEILLGDDTGLRDFWLVNGRHGYYS